MSSRPVEIGQEWMLSTSRSGQSHQATTCGDPSDETVYVISGYITIKIPPCSDAISAKQSPSSAMLTSLDEWNILERDITQYTRVVKLILFMLRSCPWFEKVHVLMKQHVFKIYFFMQDFVYRAYMYKIYYSIQVNLII